MSLLKTLRQHTLRFFLPWACAGCRTALSSLEDEGFCGACWLHLPRIEGVYCQACGVPLKDGGALCYACRQSSPSLMIRAATTYAGGIRPAIHRFKYGGRKTLAGCFSVLLVNAWDRYPELQPADALVPVPLHPANQRERGFNQAGLLAEGLSRAISLPVLEGILERAQRTRPQFQLDRDARFANMKDAFCLSRSSALRLRIRGRSLVLIDDICTTASTLAACGRLLCRAGARDVKALVLARD